MAFARVVTFEGVDGERIAELRRNIEQGEKPPDLPASEMIILHDAHGQKAMALVFFDSEDDYRKGHEVLDAMPSEGTPGRRASVQKYEVAVRATG